MTTMTPEQEKELFEMLKKHHRMQRRILAAIVIPGTIVTVIGTIGLTMWIQPFLLGSY